VLDGHFTHRPAVFGLSDRSSQYWEREIELLPTEALGNCREHREPRQDSQIECGEIEAVLADWWKELLNLDQVDLDDDFFDLGGHSLIGAQLFSAIKKKYGINLNLSLLFDVRTIRQLAEHIQQANTVRQLGSKKCSVLVPLQENGTQPPLFWIPGGYGTSVLLFKEISLLLGGERPVYGFEVPMPEANQGMPSMQERAATFVSELRSLQPQGPYHFIGFCGGGYIAYEMAQQLSAEGQEIRFLGIVECIDPQFPRDWEEKLRFSMQRAIWRTEKFLERGPVGIGRWLFDRSTTLVRGLRSGTVRFRALAGKPSSPDPELPEDFMAKAWENARRYYPIPYKGKSVVFISSDNYSYAGLSASTDPRLVWCKLSKGGSAVSAVPGDHTEMLKAPNVHEFAERLKEFLQ